MTSGETTGETTGTEGVVTNEMSLLPISGFRWARGFLLVQINGWGTCLEIHFHRGPTHLWERGALVRQRSSMP